MERLRRAASFVTGIGTPGDRFLALLEEMMQAPDGLAALEVLMRYIATTLQQASAMKVAKTLEKAGGPRIKEGIVTWIDEIEQRGERRGERRGELRGERRGELRGERKGRARIMLRLMEERFGPVSAEIAAKIEAADAETLDGWVIRVLTARTPEDVVDGGEEASGARRRAALKPATGTGSRTGRAQRTTRSRA